MSVSCGGETVGDGEERGMSDETKAIIFIGSLLGLACVGVGVGVKSCTDTNQGRSLSGSEMRYTPKNGGVFYSKPDVYPKKSVHVGDKCVDARSGDYMTRVCSDGSHKFLRLERRDNWKPYNNSRGR